MIPRMVRTLGVKTPPNVPNPALRRTSRLPVGGCFLATVPMFYIDPVNYYVNAAEGSTVALLLPRGVLIEVMVPVGAAAKRLVRALATPAEVEVLTGRPRPPTRYRRAARHP